MKTELVNKSTTHSLKHRKNKIGLEATRRNAPNFVMNIGALYFALVVLLIVAPGKFANAAFPQNELSSTEKGYLTNFTAVGRGELTWLGFSVYHASLWTKTGNFKNINDSVPIALSITYLRNIDSVDLAEKTVQEWGHLGIFEEDERETWGERLQVIWPDVEPGDSIVTLVTEDKTTKFYHNDSLITVLSDPGFGVALLSIWLDPNTSEPDLREKLIGLRGKDQ